MSTRGSILINDKELLLKVVSLSSGKSEIHSFDWKEISSVRIVKETKEKLGILKQSHERIIINIISLETPQYAIPIIIEKDKEKANFEKYVDDFKRLSSHHAFKFSDKRK